MGMVDAKNMTPSQRVLAMEALWEAMCHEGIELESPDWHEDILNERRARIAAGETGFVTLKQLREQIGK
ncbi:MAG: addiction module protein [Deltaproteobacteria bacterium]|nr:addiction module protein [Deltaproteobacteria bacterium]